MEEYTQITLDKWMQWKEDIRNKLAETASNFVYIGYRLKQIRDSGMYDGAADIFEFAEKEYGLGKSTVSRFIAINEKYSEGGNSLELKEEFRNFSSSKLSEMLTLPDNEIQLITEKTTIREIRELKNFNAQTPEAADEATRPTGISSEQEWTPLEKCLIDFFKMMKETLNGVMRYLEADPPEYKHAAEMMAPSGQASHRKGIVFLFLYDWNMGIRYKLMTEPEPVSMSWTELLNTVYHIFGACNPADVWTDFYGEPETPKEELQNEEKEEAENTAHAQSNQGLEPVATSQQKEEIDTEESHEEKAETDIPELAEQETVEVGSAEDTEKSVERVSYVGAVGDAEREKETSGTVRRIDGDRRSETATGTADSQGSQEDQLPGQMKVEDYPELLPENYKSNKKETENTGEIVQEQTEERAGSERYEEIIKQLTEKTAKQAEEISEALHEGRKELNEYRKIRRWANNLIVDLEQLMKFIDLSTPKEDEEEEE